MLVGPSGCGKSTLLRMIAGLEEIGSGEIEIGGKVVNDMQPKERDIAMVFQNYALYPHMKVRDNMAFSMLLAKRPRAEIDARVAKAAAILGLTDLLDRYPRQLSGGQRQRVAMGRCIVRDPQVFLFDEPLSNLDAKLRVAMRTELKELHQRLKTTSIYVTHDQIEAMTMADQIVVMRDGVVEQRGKPLELYDRPANLFVAGFIGSPAMNFLPGRIRREARGARVEMANGLSVPLNGNVAGEDGQHVVLGTRPEHLTLASDGQGLPATVVVVEPTGADTQVFAKVGETEVTAVFRERHDFRAGDAIRLTPDHAAHAFVRCRDRAVVADRSKPHTLRRRHVEIHETRVPERPPPARPWPVRWASEAPCFRRTRSRRRAGPRRRARSCACFAGSASSRATRTCGWRTPRSSPRRRASRCAWTSEGWEDVRPKAAVAANVGSGPDIIISTFEDAHLYPDKLVDVTDVANYLGGKYGGWYDVCKEYCTEKGKWVAVPMGCAGNSVVHRISAMKEAGFEQFPKDLAGLPQALRRRTRRRALPPGFALGNATGDGNVWCHWLVWSHGGQDGRPKGNVVIIEPGDRSRAQLRQAALRDLHPGHALVARPEQQQGLPRRPDRHDRPTASRSTTRPRTRRTRR